MTTTTQAEQEAKTQFELAFGRILRMGARPSLDGDMQEYERCRAICMDAAEVLNLITKHQGIGVHRPGWNRGVIE
jgi:hypothetical protein